MWNKVAPALETIVVPPAGARLVTDTRDIPFLQDDATDQAQVRQLNSQSILSLVNTGFEPDAAVAFCQTNDLAALMGKHTGMLSVQLQEPGSTPPAQEPPASSNGTGGSLALNGSARGQ
jgi:hypothetical protein